MNISATPSEQTHTGQVEKISTVFGIRTCDLRFTSTTLFKLSYKDKPKAGRWDAVVPRPVPGLALKLSC